MSSADGTPPSETNQKLQESKSFTIETFFSSLIVAFAVFGVQVLLFIIIKGKLPRIYRPRTYLVPEKERVPLPPTGIWQWALPVFRTSNSEFIQKCGLDAYFFLRYLRLLLKLFIPMAMVILPVLLPLNAAGGRGSNFKEGIFEDATTWTDVKGLNQLAWGNVRPTKTNRYWAHLILAVGVVLYCCYIFFSELRGYIRLRQAYLTSPQHRIRASATTVLVSAIPRKWCTAEALEGLYDVFPGGIRNIWINRNFDELSEKVKERDQIAKKLESAQTDLIKNAKKAQMKLEKKEAKAAGKKTSKAERTAEAKRKDEEAAAMAKKKGVSTGNPHQVSHSVGDLLDGHSSASSSRSSSPEEQKRKPLVPIPIVGAGIDKVGHEIADLSRTVFGGIRNVKKGVDGQLNTTQGFQQPTTRHSPENFQMDGSPVVNPPRESTDRLFDPNSPNVERHSPAVERSGTNKLHNKSQAHDNTPTTTAAEKASATKPEELEKGTATTEKKKSRFAFLKFWESEPLTPIDYPTAYDEDYNPDEDGEPLWKKYVKPKDRETHRLPVWGQKWLDWVPFTGKNVDTIEWCRKELARLNVEIEEDQKDPSRYPLLNSAFIQFNHQVAAHMACQAVSHHVPSQMAPRIVEISPDDVIWDNMSVKWWESYLRTGGVIIAVVALVIGWAVPVAFTGLLSNISSLADNYKWLAWLDMIPEWFISPIQGVLPQILLAVLLAILPIILRVLARLQGHATGMGVELAVQTFYFFFLFVQVFLVITIAAGAVNIVDQISELEKVGTNPTTITSLLASRLPSASNYFFSYLLLQALSTSAGVLVQVAALAGWFLLGPIFDSTARQKWARQIRLPDIKWGTFFPVYTNLAVIGLIYSIISPLILIFNIVTFSLFWFVYRYNTLYVTKFRFDTGGLLFPTAINQLFTGLYVMELCLIGLFLLVTGVNPDTGAPLGRPCYPQAIIMLIVFIFTILYQWLLNRAFSPLFRYLPITLEDDAVIRDEEFARAQQRKFNLVEEEQEGDDINEVLEAREKKEQKDDDAAEEIEMQNINEKRRSRHLDPRKLGDNLVSFVPGTGSWADRSRRKSHWEGDGGKAVDVNSQSPDMDRKRREKRHHAQRQIQLRLPGDAEAQQNGADPIGDALFAGIHDEIEDLTPDERDKLVQRAFQHSALRSRRPVIWIPRDDLGVSDDEIMRTKKLSKHVWISNEYTGLDSKARVVYSKSPPDFSEVDLIEL